MGKITPEVALEAINDWGVTVRAYPRPPEGVQFHWPTTAGGWDPVGVAHHHTTGSRALLDAEWNMSKKAMLRLLRVGRPDLDGPLCHFAPTYMGKGRLVAFAIGWGNTNHAGLIGADVARQLRAGTYRGGPPGPEVVDGNSILYGLEYLHPGDGTGWPDELLESGHRIACALADAHGWNVRNWPGSNAEHRELTTRKVDRSWSGWGSGLRTGIGRLAAAAEEPQGWTRTDALQEALELLQIAARMKQKGRKPRQARAIAAMAQEIQVRFPRIP